MNVKSKRKRSGSGGGGGKKKVVLDAEGNESLAYLSHRRADSNQLAQGEEG